VTRRLAALCSALVLAACSFGLTDGLRYPDSYVPGPTAAQDGLFGRDKAGGAGGPVGDVAETGSTSQLYPGSEQFGRTGTWSPEYASTADGTVTLNLVEASVPEAAKAILGNILEASYTVDPAVTGTITIQTGRPVPVDTIIAIFEAALRAKGAALIEDRGFYRISPIDSVTTSGIKITTSGASPDGQTPGTQMQVVPLQYVSALEMAAILKPMAQGNAVLRADTERNLLILSGSRPELATMLETIRIFDVDWMEGKSFGLFRLEFADPADVVKELNAIFANETGGAGKGLVKFLPNRNLNSVLVVTSRREYLDKAAGWIRRVDKLGGANDKQLYIYHIQNRPADQLAELLQKIYASQTKQGIAVASIEGGNGGGSARQSAQNGGADAQAAAETGGGFSTTTTAAADEQLPGTDEAVGADAQPVSEGGFGTVPQDLIEQAQAGGREASVSIVADEANNSLLIFAKPRDYEKILAILQRIDMQPNQVLLEATILEVSLNDQLKFGLRWFFQTDHSQFRFSDLVSGAVASAFPGFSYFLNTRDVRLAINALNDITDVNVISSPSLMVLDNRTATLQVGDEVPIATQQAKGVVAPDAPIVNAISFRNTGVILSVTPRVSDSGRVILDIEQEVSNVVPTTSSGIDSPTIQQRKIKTTVSVLDGESLTLGGLMQERDTLNRKQVPLAGDIPVIGNLFKHKDDRIARTELLIIITPRVVHNDQQASAATEEFRQQLDLSLRPAHDGPPDRVENKYRLIVR
jgi:general secretion pathway protein D